MHQLTSIKHAFRPFYYSLRNQDPALILLRLFSQTPVQQGKNQTVHPIDYCSELVRKNDWEGYLCSLLLPQAARSSVFAVRAFNTELSQISDQVSESLTGQMRLQFWRDTLNKIFEGRPPKTPVAFALAQAVKRHNLSKLWLQRMITRRESSMSDKGAVSVDELESVADDTVTSVLALTLQVLDVQHVQADHVASHVGRAVGLSNALRSVAHHATRGRCLLPADLMLKHGVSQEQVLRADKTSKLTEVTFDLASAAKLHLDTARKLKPEVPRESCVAFLPAVPVSRYLDRLQRADFDVFHGTLTRRDNLLPYRLLLAKYKSTF